MPALLLIACTNLDDVNRRLDDHDARLKALEGMVATANTDIANISSLLDAVSQKVSIVSYKALPDGSGYELVMSNDTKIVLKNGKDGNKPLVGVKKDTDGIYYWTIDGTWMLDSDGNKIKAEGKDGATGVTPKLRVTFDGYWEVSTDNGKTWQAVLGADGNPVKAVGKDGEVQLKISETKEAVTIVFNGQTFVIPKNGIIPGTDPEPKPEPNTVLPILFVAETNLTGDPAGETTFTESSYDYGWYYTVDDATKMKLPAGWHIPTKAEWESIVPDEPYCSFENSTKTYKDVKETVTVGGVSATYKADFTINSGKKSYALRYKSEDNAILSAWRYEYIKNSDGKHALEVRVRLLGASNASITIEQIGSEGWWLADKENDVIRIFPAAGESANGTQDGSGEVWDGNYCGYFISSTIWAPNQPYNYMMYLDDYSAKSSSWKQVNAGISLRLFKNQIDTGL